MMKANFDSMYSCTACETSYNVLSHSHVIFWWLGHFLGEERERERWTFWGGGGRGGLVQNRPSPDFRFREVGISGIGVD